MKNRLIPIVALALAGLITSAGAASAYTLDPTSGTGFVGKGEVQIALGMNNKQVQSATLAFTTKQAATRGLTTYLTQSATQTATQDAVRFVATQQRQTATQEVSQSLSCRDYNGNYTKYADRAGTRAGVREGERQGYRYGFRDGERTGERTGTRAGTKPGIWAGVLESDVAYEARKSNQITGFNLSEYVGSGEFIPTGGITWGDPVFPTGYTFGAYTWGAYTWGPSDYVTYGADLWFGDFTWESDANVAWGAWSNDPAKTPAECLTGDNIENISNVITNGAITPGAATYYGTEMIGNITVRPVVDGAVTEGEVGVVYTDWTPGDTIETSGAVSLYVNDVLIP